MFLLTKKEVMLCFRSSFGTSIKNFFSKLQADRWRSHTVCG